MTSHKTTPHNTLAIINSKAPFASATGKESLDIALIFASYEQGVSLFFQGDGVFQLINGHDGAMLNAKDYLKIFSAFEFYDIEQIFVCKNSLAERNLADNFHISGVEVVNNECFSEQLAKHKHILRF